MVSKLLINCMWAMGRHLPATLPISAWLCTLVTSLEPVMLLKGGLPAILTSWKTAISSHCRTWDTPVCWRATGHGWGSGHKPSRGPCCSCSAVDEVALLPQGQDLVWGMWDLTSHCHMWCTSTPPLSRGKSASGILCWTSPPRCQVVNVSS